MPLGSELAMPLIVLNMGGEMIYILHQRLQAQNVPEEKSTKVLEDVVRTMYTPLFLEELFKPQDIYSVNSTKQIFEKLAHSSIMRLNKTSMDKLYDLMTMGVKYQLISCKSPPQYLQVTLNHLDSLVDMVKSPEVTKLIQTAIAKSIEMYSTLRNGDWLLLEQVILQFFQGKKIKVSLFLQQQLQAMNGTLMLKNDGILPYGTEVPGTIRYYEDDRIIRNDKFYSKLTATSHECLELLDISSRLGSNMYLKELLQNARGKKPSNSSLEAMEAFKAGVKITSSGKFVAAAKATAPAPVTIDVKEVETIAASKAPSPSKVSRAAKSSAKEELNLLADLLGFGGGDKSSKAEEKPFKINLFPNADFQQKDSGNSDIVAGDDKDNGFIVMDIDATADAKSVSTYMELLSLNDNDVGSKAAAKDDDDDLLSLMDSAK